MSKLRWVKNVKAEVLRDDSGFARAVIVPECGGYWCLTGPLGTATGTIESQLEHDPGKLRTKKKAMLNKLLAMGYE